MTYSRMKINYETTEGYVEQLRQWFKEQHEFTKRQKLIDDLGVGKMKVKDFIKKFK